MPPTLEMENAEPDDQCDFVQQRLENIKLMQAAVSFSSAVHSDSKNKFFREPNCSRLPVISKTR
jgi:hypothetical protein